MASERVLVLGCEGCGELVRLQEVADRAMCARCLRRIAAERQARSDTSSEGTP